MKGRCLKFEGLRCNIDGDIVVTVKDDLMMAVNWWFDERR